MSRRTIITLAASAVIGMGCLAMISTDAFARGGRRSGSCYRCICTLRICPLPRLLLGLSQNPVPRLGTGLRLSLVVLISLLAPAQFIYQNMNADQEDPKRQNSETPADVVAAEQKNARQDVT